MRIALVSQEYPPETAHGGIATQTHAKATGLAALGHEVHVISRSITRERWDRAQDGALVHRLPGTHDWSLLSTDAAQWLAWSTDVAVELAALHRSVTLDVVDVPEYGAEGYVHLLNRPAWARVPTVVHLHGPVAMLTQTIGWPEAGTELEVLARHMEATCLRLADAVISSSSCSARWCESAYGIEASSVPVLHTGVDTTLFAPARTPSSRRPTVVFAGRLDRSKGVDDLVAACCDVSRDVPGLLLRLFGRGTPEALQRLRTTACAAGCPDLLEIAGHLSREQLADELPHADVFAAPSAYEGGPGMVYLEAMSCGLPAIACAGSGAAEVVLDGVTGLTVPPGDHSALVTALRRALGSEGRSWGVEARRRTVEQHDAQRAIVRFERIYAQVAAREPLRREAASC